MHTIVVGDTKSYDISLFDELSHTDTEDEERQREAKTARRRKPKVSSSAKRRRHDAGSPS